MKTELKTSDKVISDISGFSDNETLAGIIKRARLNLNLSQRKFAEKVNITQAQLCRLENGSSIKPNKKTIKSLAPYIPNKSYMDLLAYAGYTELEQEESESTTSDSIFALKTLNNLSPETIKSLSEIVKCLNDPLNIILIQQISKLMERICTEEGGYEEHVKTLYLRECILNMTK